MMACFFLTTGARLNAQTNVDIAYTYTYLNGSCVVPAVGYYYASISTMGYMTGDSVDVYVD